LNQPERQLQKQITKGKWIVLFGGGSSTSKDKN
jgi:hypothetical protein